MALKELLPDVRMKCAAPSGRLRKTLTPLGMSLHFSADPFAANGIAIAELTRAILFIHARGVAIVDGDASSHVKP